ncbi:unnamed protein product [Aspergillus oryzae]|uniref:Unnamed protein product n=2 Tax=Aspergillus oryzae TaxID=5062 RepID=A0AAN4YBP0_ASPOZ|nr:unnamed protein product [Aspergillus oryzae]GMF87427.1 unnamed protein product [Aspergillus oryzae]GMG10151.1 unnamed protein product [Aspergillus oryzae]GMG23584.1 unnamed protein product [Aspergillus oryzae]GMG46632.1 unnamed protein product [Aspergillus oryzae var. brunneus]
MSDSLSPQMSPSVAGSFSEPDSSIGISQPDIRSSFLGNFGTLQTFSSGYVRYLPLASQWGSVTGSAVHDVDADIPEEGDDLQIPFARNNISREELLAVLPPGRYCDALKDVYFRVFSPVGPALSHSPPSELISEYQRFCHDPSSVSTAWIALLFIILGIAVTALDDDDPLLSDLGREKTVSRNIKVLSTRYRSAALRCLAADGVFSRHSINSLQCLVLVNYARIHRGLPTWTLLGFTHHVAISMGCHVDPERFGLGPIEREERRRAWTGLMILYINQNNTFGGPDQRIHSQDVKFPLEINDVDLLTGGTSEPAMQPTQTTYLLLEYQLSKISSMICETLFTFAPRFSISQIETEILAIHETCDKRYQLDASGETLPSHHLANLNTLYGHLHQLFLLSLRPNLCRYLQGEVTPETCSARAKCAASAKATLAIYQSLHDLPQYSTYKWYNSGLGSFHAFHAVVVLCAILMHPDSQFEFTETHDLLWRSLDAFAALSNRSNFCSKAVPDRSNGTDGTSSRRSSASASQDWDKLAAGAALSVLDLMAYYKAMLFPAKREQSPALVVEYPPFDLESTPSSL